MGRLTNASRDRARREAYVDLCRRMVEMAEMVADPPGTVYPDDGLPRAKPGASVARFREHLRRVEAGETVSVAGWQIGIANSETYEMDAAGRLTPVETTAGVREGHGTQ